MLFKSPGKKCMGLVVLPLFTEKEIKGQTIL